MGLAEPRKRMKISHDPNNTNWTGNTDNYGHKIMQAQGWQPGNYLGAKDANHAEHYTAANASHIRVLVKTDNLGLGAKNGSGLNGADEDELEKEQKSREELRRAIYRRGNGEYSVCEGGFLIGDKIEDLIDGEAERIRKLADGEDSGSSSSSSSDEEAPVENLKKSKKSKKRKAEAEKIPEVFAVKEKKSKKMRKLEASLKEDVQLEVEDSADESEKKKRKKEKKEKKERKEQKRALKAGLAEASAKDSRKKSKKDKRKSNLDDIAESSESTSRITPKESTPATPISDSGRSTPIMQGRHAVRSRNIAQKRLASMDVASLNQIFMIKAPS